MDQATGFYFENGKWGVAGFREGRKFLITLSSGLAGETIWKMTEFGNPKFNLSCRELEDALLKEKVISCRSLAYEVRMHKKSLRIFYAYLYGYWEGDDNNENTPHVAIGKCSPM
jgi:hypothetical protein